VIDAALGQPRTRSSWSTTRSTDGSADFVAARFPARGSSVLRCQRIWASAAAPTPASAPPERHRRAAQQRHARGARLSRPAARGLHRRKGFRRLLPDLLQRPRTSREETGLTQGWWRTAPSASATAIDPEGAIDLFPCFYGGGGSCAFDRRKFLDLGGFDEPPAPFYLEDTDLGYMAWKRGWKVLYQPPAMSGTSTAAPSGSTSARVHPGHPEEELHPLLLEEHPRVAYPILPPVHGGAVFMSQTTCQLAELTDLHIIVLLDRPEQQGDHAALANRCRSTTFLARMPGRPKGVGSILPFAIREFSNPDLDWVIHRTIYLRKIDAVQLDYLHMAQYAGQYRQIGCFLFEHDLYFQTVARQLPGIAGLGRRAAATFEYLRALRYELRVLPSFDRVQVCSGANMRYLASFLPSIAHRLDPDLRAGITVSNYPFQTSRREPDTILFLGSFRHAPNTEALQWFARAVLPQILSERPSVRLIVVGSDPPPQHSLPDFRDALEFRGYVANILEPLHRYAVFVCPIRSGSGVRVKLLEAFATGIPVVSTHVGAEGLAEEDGSVCRLSDDGPAFAEAVLDLLADPDRAELMACRARRYVEKDWDLSAATRRLLQTYTTVVEEKRSRVTR
jgi:glycosyltransferase involved in cell wall biosynthesis